MSPEAAIIVKYENILTQGFIANVLLQANDYPNKGTETGGGGVKLLLVAIWKGRHEDYMDETSTSYYEACLMDGSHTLFRGRFSPEMRSYIAKNRDIIDAGSVLVVKYYSLMWLTPRAHGEHRMVMLIDSFSVETPPASMICGVLPPTVNRRAISKRAVKEVLQQSSLLFLGERETGASSRWTPIPRDLVRQGYFLPDSADKAKWLGKAASRNHQTVPTCDCQKQLQFTSCILRTKPISELDEQWMLKTIRFPKHGVEFDSLSPLERRECVTKHYKLFYFSMHHGEYSIPSCFEQHLRQKYPISDNKNVCVSPPSANADNDN